jgi:ribosomal protein S27AE
MAQDNFDKLAWAMNSLKQLIKPCPMCGGTDIAIHVPNADHKEDVTCLSCGLKLEKAKGIGVVKYWNLRTSPKKHNRNKTKLTSNSLASY